MGFFFTPFLNVKIVKAKTISIYTCKNNKWYDKEAKLMHDGPDDVGNEWKRREKKNRNKETTLKLY